MILGSPWIGAVCQIPFSEETFFFSIEPNYISQNTRVPKTTLLKSCLTSRLSGPQPPPACRSLCTQTPTSAQSPHVFLLSGGD